MAEFPARFSTGVGDIEASACPYHGGSSSSSSLFSFDDWLESDLRCSAGKREFQLGRYQVDRVRNGYQFGEAFHRFAEEVAGFRKTGFLAIVPTRKRFASSADELRFLGEIMVEAGFAESAGALIRSQTVALPLVIDCPVTGITAVYEFFPVAFCCRAADPGDDLYDPALSSPFLGINTTSDAFAFGMLVRDLSMRHFHCQPFEIEKRADFERLLERCVSAWQNMSANTIRAYGKVSARPERAVELSADEKSWYAPHNDPVFAELVKERHGHEMPIVYARRLASRWIAALYDGSRYSGSRDGQSGGIPAFAAHP